MNGLRFSVRILAGIIVVGAIARLVFASVPAAPKYEIWWLSEGKVYKVAFPVAPSDESFLMAYIQGAAPTKVPNGPLRKSLQASAASKAEPEILRVLPCEIDRNGQEKCRALPGIYYGRAPF